MFIRAEDGNKVDYTKCGDPYVEPLSPDEWSLCIKTLQGTIHLIAAFPTVLKANRALDSLKGAINKSHGWDAKEYKKTINN
jgi:hypothetical protein